MAPRKRKKIVKKVKFQLTRSGIVGIAVVCFCIFLWMFLIGVWAGQSLLYQPVSSTELSTRVTKSGEGKLTKKSEEKQVLEIIHLEAHKKKKLMNN